MRARYPLPLLLLVCLLGGCTDSLGFGQDCSAEKTEVRLREGRGPDDVQGPNEVGGDFTERWYYYSGGQTRTYTFRWGVSYQGCEVDGGAGFARIPITG
jgi:hypothetical protein